MSQVNQLDRAVRRSFMALCQNVGTPLAFQSMRMLEADDWVGLTTIKVVIRDYKDPCALSGDLQIAAFFKKYPGFDLGVDLEMKAVRNFEEAEHQCYKTNERLDPLLRDKFHYGLDVAAFIDVARKEVSRILGRCPQPHQLDGGFGPGSTFLDVGPLTTVPDKMSSSYTLTSTSSRFLPAWRETAWHRYACAGLEPVDLETTDIDLIVESSWFVRSDGVLRSAYVKPPSPFACRTPTLIRGNRFTTVPKDAWKHRGICIEPSINLFYQLGVGTWLTRRLGRTVGWHKKDIQQFHQLLARLGSLLGHLATIDLSNASDTICRALVQLLLPWDWYELLDDLRSKHTRVDGRWVKLEKFSSMGNGFTFELETIIFRAIAVAAQKCDADDQWFGNTVSTFGDDIVVPTRSADDVIAALKFFGMETNKDKTFTSGSFRESCGGDYFKGMDMRPHYLKEEPNEPHQFIALANGLRRFGIRHILCGGPDVYRKPWLCILDAIPSRIRSLLGPEALGDLLIHDKEERWNYKVRSSIRYFRVWRPVEYGCTGWEHFRPGVVLASALFGVPDGSPKSVDVNERWLTSGVSTRVNDSYISGYRFGRVAYS